MLVLPGDFENSVNHYVANVGGGCRNAGVGTSFACPVISGVAALMLEANPNLSWRDVQGILAQTSRPVNDPRDTSETTNAAGLWHSNLYGFGIVDATAAVETSKSWDYYGPEMMLIGESGPVNLLITDNFSSSVTSTATVSASANNVDFVAESVLAYLDLKHFSRGDLEVVLTSPQGTRSILHPGKRPENSQLEDSDRWKLLSVRNWGESAVGDWSLSITDMKTGYVADCANEPFYITSLGDDDDRFM
jgi:hypothetical protein